MTDAVELTLMLRQWNGRDVHDGYGCHKQGV